MSCKVTTKWTFDENFREIFLDIWYEKLPESYNYAHGACNQVGNDMIIWLSETNKDLYKNIYSQALKETQDELIAWRLG